MYNRFFLALGVGVVAWGLFRLLGYFLGALANFLGSFSRWYQYSAAPNAERMAIAYLLVTAVFFSRNN